MTDVITPSPRRPVAPSPRRRANPERLAADRELCEQLRTDGFKGLRFLQLRDDLWVYGWKAVRAWMRDGSIVERCYQRDIFFAAWATEREAMMRQADVRDEIAHHCVSEAVGKLMDSLAGDHHWEPDGGATMRTYFITFCLWSFRDAFRKWASDYRRRLREAMDGYGHGPGSDLSAPDRMVLQDTLNRILEGASLEEKAICQLILSHDATQEQIAAQLGMTRKAVERRMARVRKRGTAYAIAVGIDMLFPSVQTGMTH
ncbi:sigma-70 family RNA polymerase sigma factor [Streptomyces sp. NPDC058611]|uniref:sigma-70 family RNA polymerase sigma factor n=1 Tax=unclassified Streptomyces TaxID=2593676 RepID=UPI00364A4A9A